jgi:hypothetical protein
VSTSFSLPAYLGKAITRALSEAPADAPPCEPHAFVSTLLYLAKDAARMMGVNHLDALAVALAQHEPDEEKAISRIRQVYAGARAVAAKEALGDRFNPNAKK